MKPFYLAALLAVIIIGVIPVSEGIDLTQYQASRIKVSVSGAVLQDEIIDLPCYSTIDDLLKEITVTAEADLSSLNRTVVLKDNDAVVIPVKTEVQKISINLADEAQLQKISGIGPVMAGRIVEYRRQHGLFQTLEQLLKVKGIGAKTLEKIRPYICL